MVELKEDKRFEKCSSLELNKLEFARFYKRCAATLNWLTGACSQSDTFKC